jgi:hypothetical protein
MDELREILRAMLAPLEQFGDRQRMAVMPRYEVAGVIGDLAEAVKKARALHGSIDEVSVPLAERQSLQLLGENLASMDLLLDRLMAGARSIDDAVLMAWPMPRYLRGVRVFLRSG